MKPIKVVRFHPKAKQIDQNEKLTIKLSIHVPYETRVSKAKKANGCITFLRACSFCHLVLAVSL